MEKCIKCNKISYSLANGLCKRCSKESNMTINKCFRCEKITAYSIDGMCIECSQMRMSLETIIKKLAIKDPKKLSDILKVKESLIIKMAEAIKIKGFLIHECHKCGRNIERIGLCDNCSKLYNTLKNMDHVKKLRKISEKGEGSIHVKTK